MATGLQWVREAVDALIVELGAGRAESVLLMLMSVPTTPNRSVQEMLTKLLTELRRRKGGEKP